jgi:hypothetical protein
VRRKVGQASLPVQNETVHQHTKGMLQPDMNTAIDWQPRPVPLTPVAVVAEGDAARALARRLLAFEPDSLAQWQGAFYRDNLILLGEETTLPWVDGARYLGRDPEAPSLLLPTNLQPSVPVSLLERALRQQAKGIPPPLIVLPHHKAILSVSAARAIARDTLLRWMANYP